MLTEKEKQVIINIAENEYAPLNGDVPTRYVDASGGVWADCINTGPYTIPEKSIPGLCSSLSKKGLIACDSVFAFSQDACVGLTEKGFEIYLDFNRG